MNLLKKLFIKMKMSELRWNGQLGEWVVTATHRMDRTFLPPSDYCPLCPTAPGGFETEIPRSDFEVAVFENLFPYIMVLHQEPVNNGCGLGHLHFEFYPPLRDAQKLKYLAGCEQGAETFINDSLPEEKAAELRKIINGGGK